MEEVRDAMRKRRRMKIIRKVEVGVLSFVSGPTDLAWRALGAYDMRKG